MLLLVLFTVTAVAAAQGNPTIDRTDPQMADRSLTISGSPAVDLDEVIEVFVQLDGPSVAAYVAEQVDLGNGKPSPAQQRAYANQIANQQAAFRADLAAAGATELSALQVGANGFRVTAQVRDIAALSQLDGVATVAKVTQHTVSNESSVPWIGAPAAWASSGTGEGVSIAVIDTGIDYNHANLGGSGDPADYAANDSAIIEPGSFPTAKVVGGYDFAGTSYDAGGNLGPTTPSPDPDPLDGHGHGSHVAGTAAGLGVAGTIGEGVAPGASLYALKVFGDVAGSTDLTSEAIEWALDPNGDGSTDDHVDVINMSLGSPFGDPNDPSAISSKNAMNMGIIVVASAGNEGPADYVTGSPGVAANIISVAASVDGGYSVLGLAVNAPAAIAGTYEAAESAIGVPLDVAGPLTGDLVIADPLDACTPLTNGAAMAGKIALVQRGACNFSNKHLEAQAVGAVGILVFNNVAGDPIVMGGSSAGITIPGLMVSLADGSLIHSTISGGDTVNVTMDSSVVVLKPELADTIAGFSSRGPGHGGSTFKPDVSAPGFGIFSTAVGSGTEGASSSGTSMAAPHVAGVAALMREAFPGASTHQIKAMIQNATVTANSGGPGTDTPYDLARQGVGVVRVDQAVELSSLAMPGGVSFGRVNPYRPERVRVKVNVTNFSSDARTYDVTHVENQTMPGATISGPASVYVPAHSHKIVWLTLEFDPTLAPYDNAFFSQSEVDGWFVFDDGVDALRVGYMATVDPASKMTARSTRGGVRIANTRGNVGWAEGFTMTNAGGLFLDNGPMAIRAMGVRTNYYGVDVVEFGFATKDPWETLSAHEVDIYLDVDEDGFDDYVLVAADLGVLQGNDPSGTVVTALFDLVNGGGFLEWFAGADFNDSAAIFTVDRNGTYGFLDVGDATFDYTVVTFARDGAIDLQFGSADLDAEIVPEFNSFGLPAGTSVTVGTEGGPGNMLWLFQNNPTKSLQSYRTYVR